MSVGSAAANLAKKRVRKHIPGGESRQCKGPGGRKPGTFKELEGGRKEAAGKRVR